MLPLMNITFSTKNFILPTLPFALLMDTAVQKSETDKLRIKTESYTHLPDKDSYLEKKDALRFNIFISAILSIFLTSIDYFSVQKHFLYLFFRRWLNASS